MVEQLRDAPQRPNDVGVFDRSALFVAHRLDELCHPDTDINSERRVLERLDMNTPTTGLEQFPEALDAHLLSIGFIAPLALRRQKGVTLPRWGAPMGVLPQRWRPVETRKRQRRDAKKAELAHVGH